jgi:Na+/melibiose symporter-like transporter
MPLKYLLQYGLPGFPLALLSLPVYVYVPQLYTASYGWSLTAIGLILLASRVADAFFDPWFGAWLDKQQHPARFALTFALATLPVNLGFWLLFHPLQNVPAISLCAGLLLVYLGFSSATIALQSWGRFWAIRSKPACN